MTKAAKMQSFHSPRRIRVSIQSKPDEVCRVEQHHKQACDINHILKRFDRDGVITHVNTAKAEYGDYSEINEFQESLNLVIQAENNFMQLPSSIRKRFANDPGNFMEFITDPKNIDEMVELGLANPPKPETKPAKVEIVNPDAIASKEPESGS